MMLRASLLMAALCLSLSVQAQPQWAVDSSAVTFSIRNAGLPVSGSFRGLEADVRFNPERVEAGRFTASLDVATIDTGIGLRDRHLRSDDYFDAATYPRITMTATEVRQTGPGAYEGTFDLTIRDVTQPITMPFTFDPATGMLQGSFDINRRDFGVGGRSLMLANGVGVDITVWVQPAP